jgi:hypothetical protein
MRRILPSLLAVALPFSAAAFEWGGQIGFDYLRDDTWNTGGEHAASPRLGLHLGLTAIGFLVRPDILSYSATGMYNLTSIDRASGGTDERDNLTFRGTASVLRGPRNPLSLELSATRTTEDLTATGAPSLSNVSTQWGVVGYYAQPDRPRLSLGYTHTDSERTSSAAADANRTVETVTGTLQEGTGTFTYNAAYRGNFSEGTFAADNFQDHRVNLGALANAGSTWRVQLADGYFLRVPTVVSTSNPRQEYNVFSGAAFNGSTEENIQRLSYRYNHGIQERPLNPTIERSAHRLDYQLQSVLTPEWRLQTVAELGYSEDRLGTTDEAFTAETLSTLAYWRKTTAPGYLELRGGPSIGYVQPVSGDPFFGFGLTGGVAWERQIASAQARINYQLNFSNDLRARGTTLGQTGSAGIGSQLGTGFASATLIVGAFRTDGDLFGTRFSRSVALTGSYRKQRSDGTIQFGVTDTANAALDETVIADGLIIPPAYDSSSRYVLLNGRTGITRNTSVTGQVRFSSNKLPDRPDTSEADVRAGFELNYGALRVALEDRYFVTFTDGADQRVNQILIRIYRALGSGI